MQTLFFHNNYHYMDNCHKQKDEINRERSHPAAKAAKNVP